MDGWIDSSFFSFLEEGQGAVPLRGKSDARGLLVCAQVVPRVDVPGSLQELRHLARPRVAAQVHVSSQSRAGGAGWGWWWRYGWGGALFVTLKDNIHASNMVYILCMFFSWCGPFIIHLVEPEPISCRSSHSSGEVKVCRVVSRFFDIIFSRDRTLVSFHNGGGRGGGGIELTRVRPCKKIVRHMGQATYVAPNGSHERTLARMFLKKEVNMKTVYPAAVLHREKMALFDFGRVGDTRDPHRGFIESANEKMNTWHSALE